MNSETLYNSSFQPSQLGISVLEKGKILMSGENPSLMIERVVNEIAGAENIFSTDATEIKHFASQLGDFLDQEKIVFSTPIMTNASRVENKPLSACTVPRVDLKKDLNQVKKIIDSYHQDAMGTGFNLTEVDNPVAILLYLNEVAISGAKSGKEDRPVGNIAICKIDHPKIIDFILSKKANPNIDWKFNISIDTPQEFWDAVKNNSQWTLKNGQTIPANELLHIIAESAHTSADPGIICLDRLNIDNPTPGVGLYTSTAPCAEVGLVPGETCQFGYINIAKFINQFGEIDYTNLSKATQIMVRSLDNTVELSIGRYSIKESSQIMSAKRKIGVGICGVADMLISMELPYDSDKSRNLCRDILAFINYQTKIASIDLAKKRGSFGAMNMKEGCRYNENPGFIEQKYGQLKTNTVSTKQWNELGDFIRKTKLLRNCSTTALPPTGRSGLVINASTGIEPLFSLSPNNLIHPSVKKQLQKTYHYTVENLNLIEKDGSCQHSNLPNHIKQYLKTATEIEATEHLKMISAIQPCIDESISKTINLSKSSTVSDIKNIYIQAYDSGLKGITIYRDGSLQSQPKKIIS
jgi:ribonucleoside-diphosphate reductase alpha chain